MIKNKTALDNYYNKLVEDLNTRENSSIDFPLIENTIISVPAKKASLISTSEVIVTDRNEFIPDEVANAVPNNEYDVITNQYRYYLLPVEFTYRVKLQRNIGIAKTDSDEDIKATVKTKVPYSNLNKKLFKNDVIDYAIKNGIATSQYSYKAGTAELISVDCIVMKEKYFG